VLALDSDKKSFFGKGFPGPGFEISFQATRWTFAADRNIGNQKNGAAVARGSKLAISMGPESTRQIVGRAYVNVAILET
jgi:hypothetical protein